MKKLIFILFALMASLQINAQESYLPVFNGNKISFLYQAGMATDGNNCSGVIPNIYWKDTDRPRTYTTPFATSFMSIEYNEDNSKLWGYAPSYGHGPDWILLMDLNLEVGDEYSYPISNEICVVTNIYEKDGRKHIEFNKNILVEWKDERGERYYISVPFMFIEGIGMNCFHGMVFAKFNDDIQDYRIPEIDDVLSDCYSEYLNIVNNIIDTKKNLIAVTFLSSASIQVHIPAEAVNNEVQLNIVDTTGKLIKSVNVTGKETIVDINNFPAGVYVLYIPSLPNYTGKFIKK